MSFPFFTKSIPALLGVDLGTSSVKVVEITRTGGRLQLSNYGEITGPMPLTATPASSLKIHDAQVADQIALVLRQAGIHTRDVVLGIPLFSSFSTIIEFPRIPEAELEQAVFSEARKYIPIPLAEVQLDWVKIPFLSTEHVLKVLVVAVPKDILNKYSTIASHAGINVRAMELETFATARALVGPDPDTTLILDVGARSTNISIVAKGMTVVHHNTDISGLELSRAIARSLNIDLPRAEDLKIRKGLEGDAQVRDILASFLDPVVVEIQRIVQDYRQKGGDTPRLLVLTGGSSRLLGFTKYLEQVLVLPVKLSNPFDALSYPTELKATLSQIGASFSVAVGLALRKI